MEDEKYTIELSKINYDYLSEMLEVLYKDISKFPKRMRTSKFDILEDLVKNVFIK